MRTLPLLIALLLATFAAPAAASTSWSDAGELGTVHDGHTATLLQDGSVLVVGGAIGWAAAQRFDPATGTWRPAAAPAIPRSAHTATLLSDGDVLVAGGAYGGLRAEAERYDPATDTWTPAASMGSGHAGHVAALLPDGRVLVAGGNGATAEIYDPVADAWTPTAPLSTPRTSAAAAVLADGDVLVAGGGSGAGGWADRYDVATGTWTTTGPLTGERWLPGAATLADGSVLLAGGVEGMATTARVERYDPAANTWSNAASLREGRLAKLTALADGRVLAVGSGVTAELFDPVTGRWTAADALSTTRNQPTATLLGDGSVLVAGGGVLRAERYRHASRFDVTGAYFGDRAVGAAGAPASLVVRNTGPQRLIVTGVTLAGAPDFAIVQDGCTGTRVAPSATCRIAVAFSPAAAGERTAQLRVMSDTGDAVAAEVAGTGLAAPAAKPPAKASASCARRSRRAARCRFSLPGASGWSAAKVALKRGKRTVASGRVLAWKGRGSLTLRGKRKLRGDYALVVRVGGRAPVRLPVALR